MPPWLQKVSKGEFFATVGQMNVHPRAEPEAIYWETPYRELKGKTTPGYMGVGEKAYFIVMES